MCLSVITKFVEPTDEVVEAWKFVYTFYTDDFILPYSTYRRSKVLPKDQWIKAERIIIHSGDKDTYYSGFHCFTKYEDAMKMTPYKSGIIKVFVRRIHVIGVESYWASSVGTPLERCEVLVADEIFVPNQVPVPRDSKYTWDELNVKETTNVP